MTLFPIFMTKACQFDVFMLGMIFVGKKVEHKLLCQEVYKHYQRKYGITKQSVVFMCQKTVNFI